MRKSEELFKLASKMKQMSPAVIIGYLKAVYKEGYRDGHAACCDELGLEDGDEVTVIDEEDLGVSLNNYKEIKK